MSRLAPASEAHETVHWLWSQVHDRYPFLKEPKLEKWVDEVDKIHRIDGYEWALIKQVAFWSQQDAFWRQQIRSGTKLRKHFETMMIRVYEEQKTKPQVFKI